MNTAKLAATAALTMCISVAIAAPPAARTSGYVAKTERGQLAQQIIRRWSGYVNQIYGTTPMQWSQAMEGTFSAADISNLRTASKRQTYEAMMGTLVGQNTTDAKIIDALAKSNGSTVSVKTLGSPSEDLVYTMINPCRIADTRVAGGALSRNIARSFVSDGANFTAQGGSNGSCGIPANASAVVMNVTVVNPVNGPGNIKLFPYGVTPSTTASVNFAKNQIVGNELIVKQTLGQPFDFSAISNFDTHLVIDVSGYFMAPEATALACVNAYNAAATTFPVDTFASVADSAIQACPAGYTGINYIWQYTGGIGTLAVWNNDYGNSFSAAHVKYNATSGFSNLTVRMGRRCCRVPGR